MDGCCSAGSRFFLLPNMTFSTGDCRGWRGPDQDVLSECGVVSVFVRGTGFRNFVESMIRVPVQVIVAARQIRVRLLAWNSEQRIFLGLADVVERPMLC